MGVVAMPEETLPIDFEAERDRDSSSWERACEQPVLIERVAWDRWIVTLADSEDTHLVQLHRDHGAYLGHCTVAEADEECPGWKYHDGPCAHLCAVRRAEFGNRTDTHGQPIRVFDIEAVVDARADHAVETSVATDGGVRR